jgi:hypothetical protein
MGNARKLEPPVAIKDIPGLTEAIETVKSLQYGVVRIKVEAGRISVIEKTEELDLINHSPQDFLSPFPTAS